MFPKKGISGTAFENIDFPVWRKSSMEHTSVSYPAPKISRKHLKSHDSMANFSVQDYD
jgi:hypothetical protein